MLGIDELLMILGNGGIDELLDILLFWFWFEFMEFIDICSLPTGPL